MNQELIKRLAAGEIQLKDTGTVEQLNEILLVAFPDNSEVNGNRMYYESADYNNCWYYDDTPSNLPIYTTEQFFEVEHTQVTESTYDPETQTLSETFEPMPKQKRIFWQCNPNENPFGDEDETDHVPDVRKTMDAETRELAKQLFVAKMYAGNLPSANAMNQAIDNAKQFIQLLNNE